MRSQVKATGFKNEVGQAVNDDHLPLNDARIPTIALIDFNYPYWHTKPNRSAQRTLLGGKS